MNMEILNSESEDQKADNSENNSQGVPSVSHKVDTGSVQKNPKSQIENAAKLKNKLEKNVQNAGSSKGNYVSEVNPNSDSYPVISKSELEQEKLNQSKVKADVIKIKVKAEMNHQSLGKMEALQIKGKLDPNQEKALMDQHKAKLQLQLLSINANKMRMMSDVAQVSTKQDVTPYRVKAADQGSSKMKQDPKTKLNTLKSPAKMNAFQIRAAAFDTESKPKAETVPKESGKVKKKFYFLFRVKEFNIITVKRDDLKYKCHVCNGIYRQKFSLKRHFLRNHISHEYISFADISNCKINVPNEKIMQQVAEETKTPSGRKRFKTKDAIFLEGNKSRLMPGLYRCHECSEIKFDLEAELKAHYVTHPATHGDENFSCDYCSAVFQKRAVLNKHVALHHEKRSSYTCKNCKLEFMSDAELQKHLSHASGGKCKYCEKEFCTAAMRKKHESVHEGMKGYSCKHCHEVFAKVEDVKKHVVKNHASLYLTCPHCPKQAFPHMFATEALLGVHVREKHDRKTITAYFGSTSDSKAVNGKDKGINAKVAATSAESVCNYCQKKFPGVRAMFKHKTIAHKKLLHKHKTAAHKKNVLAKKQSNMAAKQKAFNKKIANEKKIHQQKKLAKKNRVLQKERTTYERKAKQAVQDKSVIERFSTRRIKMESTRMAMNKFFATLSQNIAENLLNHVDGRAHQLSLKEYSLDDNNEFLDDSYQHNQDQIPWSSYNFPIDFNVRLALDKRGREIKPNMPAEEQCLFATGLEKVIHAKENIDPLKDSTLDLQAKEEKVYDAAALRKMSLDEKKKLLQYDPLVVFVCSVCKQTHSSFQEMDDHSHNNHPNVEVTWVEIEGTKHLPPVAPVDLCRQPYISPDGVLFSCVVPPPLPEVCTLKCTKCKRVFQKSSELHPHLLECGGNEGFRPKYRKKVNLQKRIKHTMKHRIDLSVRQVASKKDSPYKNNLMLNGVMDKTKIKYGKDYFSTKTGKSAKTQTALSYQQKSITCFFCKEKFETKLLLTEHYSVCRKFNRKKKGKAGSPNSKKTLNNSSKFVSQQSKQATQLGISTNNVSPKSADSGLDLTMASAENVPVLNSISDTAAQSATPVPIVSTNNLSKSSNHLPTSSAMDLSVKLVNPANVTKVIAPENSKTNCNENTKEKTPIEALRETVQKIATNENQRDSANFNLGKSSSPQRAKKPAASSEVPINKNFVSANPVAPKPTVLNPKDNLPKIKEVINEIKRAASNSPNHKKSVVPLMFIVSNADNSAAKNINSAISTPTTKLNNQIENESKEQPFTARRQRKKGQPTKIIQKSAEDVIESASSNSQKDTILVNKNKEDRVDMLQSVVGLQKNDSLNNTVQKEVNESEKSIEKPLDAHSKTSDELKKSIVKQSISTPVMDVVSSNATTSTTPDLACTESKHSKITTTVVTSNEKVPAQSEDRESPTLELLVSSVTQNIKNFDKTSFLDEALPSLNISTSRPMCDKAIMSARKSLNFCVIIPDAESPSNSLRSEDQQSQVIPNSSNSELPNKSTTEATNLSPKKSSDLPPYNVEKPVNSNKTKSISQLKENQCGKTASNSETNIEQTITSTSSQSQESILVNKDELSVNAEMTSQSSISEGEREQSLLSTSTEMTAKAMENHDNASEIVKVSANKVPQAVDNIPKSATSLEQLHASTSVVDNAEASPKVSIDNGSEEPAEPFDSLEITFAAVLRGGSWRRGRRPSRRGMGRRRSYKRNSFSTMSDTNEKLDLSTSDISSPDISKKSKITKAKQSLPTLNVSSQLRAFRLENANKSLNDTLSSKSDHSNSSEVSSDFGKDLASRMKERMRLSFGTVPKENGIDAKSEASTTVVDQGQNNPPANSSDASETNLNSTGNSSLQSQASESELGLNAESCQGTVPFIKKEYKEPDKRHICPYCILEFAYLTNFRRHLKVCKSKQVDSADEIPSSSNSTSQIQHLPKKEEVEESMLNLLRHQSRQNQMIKETQPVANDLYKNFQRFTCELCHTIFLSLFKLMQHKINDHKMDAKERDNTDDNLDEDCLSPGNSVISGAGAISMLSLEDVPVILPSTEFLNTANFFAEDKLEQDESAGDESSLAVVEQNQPPEANVQETATISEDNDALSIQAKSIDSAQSTCEDSQSKAVETESSEPSKDIDIEDTIETANFVKPQPKAVDTSASDNKHSNEPNKPVKEKSSFLQKKYKQVIDPKYFAIPYAKGRGRKKKSVIESEKKAAENVDKIDVTEKIELNIAENKDETKTSAKKSNENLKEKESITDSAIASTSNEQSKRDIYLTILTNCKKISTVKKTSAKETKDNNEVMIIPTEKDITEKQSSPVGIKKRGRPRLSSIIEEKKEMSSISEMETEVLTVSSEKNGIKISVTRETNPLNLSLHARGAIPKQRGRKRISIESIPPAKFPKLKRGKYIRVKKVPVLTLETSEFENDDASFIVSDDEDIPSPIQSTKFQSQNGAKPSDIPQVKVSKGRQSAITKPVPGLSMNKSSKVSKSLKNVSSSTAGTAVESSLTSNSSGSKAKKMKNFVKPACDIAGPSTFTKGAPKNSKASKMPDDMSDFQQTSFGKKLNKICPICKKKFSSTLLRSRHVKMVHGRKNNRAEVELPLDLNEGQKVDIAAESRAKFQRHCIKPLPPMKRKYKKTMNSIARLKKQKI